MKYISPRENWLEDWLEMGNKRKKWARDGAEASSVHDYLWEDSSTSRWEVIQKTSLQRNMMNDAWGVLGLEGQWKIQGIKALTQSCGGLVKKTLSSSEASVPLIIIPNQLSFFMWLTSLMTGRCSIFLSIQCFLPINF